MLLADSMIQVRYHCRPKREMHSTPLQSFLLETITHTSKVF